MRPPCSPGATLIDRLKWIREELSSSWSNDNEEYFVHEDDMKSVNQELDAIIAELNSKGETK